MLEEFLFLEKAIITVVCPESWSQDCGVVDAILATTGHVIIDLIVSEKNNNNRNDEAMTAGTHVEDTCERPSAVVIIRRTTYTRSAASSSSDHGGGPTVCIRFSEKIYHRCRCFVNRSVRYEIYRLNSKQL